MKFNSSNDNTKRRESGSSSEVDYELLGSMLDDCQLHLALFNAWEESFIEDMVERVKEKRPLTIRQRETIESCHDKVTRRRRV